MAEDGIVGTYNGSNAREVLFTAEHWEQLKSGAKLAESACDGGRVRFNGYAGARPGPFPPWRKRRR